MQTSKPLYDTLQAVAWHLSVLLSKYFTMNKGVGGKHLLIALNNAQHLHKEFPCAVKCAISAGLSGGAKKHRGGGTEVKLAPSLGYKRNPPTLHFHLPNTLFTHASVYVRGWGVARPLLCLAALNPVFCTSEWGKCPAQGRNAIVLGGDEVFLSAEGWTHSPEVF